MVSYTSTLESGSSVDAIALVVGIWARSTNEVSYIQVSTVPDGRGMGDVMKD